MNAVISRKPTGFSLVELVLVIALCAILFVGGISILDTSQNAERYEQTRRQMEAFKVAMLGDNSLNPQGRRSNFGYVGDWGSLPTLLSNLTTAQVPAWAYNSTYGFGAGWKGPYLNPSFNAGVLTNDGWQRAFVWAPAGSPPSITSYGADGGAGGSGYNADLVMQLPASLWRGTVSGKVLNQMTPLAARTVEIRYPVAGVMTAFTTTTAADGSFSFSNVPFGVRSLAVTAPSPTLGPKQIIVDVNNYEVPSETLNYFSPPVNLSTMCCRLSLDNSAAVTTSDITGVHTIYLVPYKGNVIPLYDGTMWKNHYLSSAISSDRPAANTVFDIFVYDNAGTLTLETTNWTNDSTRATALSTQDGILVRSNNSTRRYLGTARTDSSRDLNDSVRMRTVWNYYNRIPRPLLRRESDNNWNYSTNTWRAANNDTTNRVEIVVGDACVILDLLIATRAQNTAASTYYIGIGEDRTNGSDADYNASGSATIYTYIESHLKRFPSAGYHYYQWVENGGGTVTTSFSCNNACGLTGVIDG